MISTNENSTVYAWSEFKCELCNEFFPCINKIANLFENNRLIGKELVKTNFLVLETPDFIRGIPKVTIMCNFNHKNNLHVVKELLGERKR